MYDNIIKILNLEYIRNRIESIDTISNNNNLSFIIRLKNNGSNCPKCNSLVTTVHDYQKKSIVHSISTNTKCFIIYKARRHKCHICNSVFYEHNPFANKYEKISTYTKISILEHLKSYTHTFTSAAREFNVTTQTVIDIFDKHIEANRRKLPRVICIDEFFTAKMSRYKYACLLLDFNSSKVIEIYTTRHKKYIIEQFSRIPREERNHVKAFIIDMWDSYKEAIRVSFPNALIAVDSFHIIRTLNEIVRKVRLKIMRKYDKNTSSLEANDMYYYMLKKFHYFLLKDYDDLSDKFYVPKISAYLDKATILDYLLSIDDELKDAYQLKEQYRTFNRTAVRKTCEPELDQLITLFRNHINDDFRAFGKTLQRWKIEIMSSFIRVNGRRLSNGPIEGINSKIKTIIKSANGIKDFYRLRKRIMFSLNQDLPIKLSK